MRTHHHKADLSSNFAPTNEPKIEGNEGGEGNRWVSAGDKSEESQGKPTHLEVLALGISEEINVLRGAGRERVPIIHRVERTRPVGTLRHLPHGQHECEQASPPPSALRRAGRKRPPFRDGWPAAEERAGHLWRGTRCAKSRAGTYEGLHISQRVLHAGVSVDTDRERVHDVAQDWVSLVHGVGQFVRHDVVVHLHGVHRHMTCRREYELQYDMISQCDMRWRVQERTSMFGMVAFVGL